MKSLSEVVGRHDEERLLCPVRALKYYLKATESVSPRPRNLFLSVKQQTRPLSKNGLSFFLRDVIVSSHRSLSDQYLPLYKVKAHDIRGVATSLNFWKNKSLSSVMQAATWRTASVFARHYLKDLSRFTPQQDLWSLGPFVASGAILEPATSRDTSRP